MCEGEGRKEVVVGCGKGEEEEGRWCVWEGGGEKRGGVPSP